MKDFLCLSCCYRWSISLQRKTTVLKSSGWSVVIDGQIPLKEFKPWYFPTYLPSLDKIKSDVVRIGFNPAPSVHGATLFTGYLEVHPSGVGPSKSLIRAAPRFLSATFMVNTLGRFTRFPFGQLPLNRVRGLIRSNKICHKKKYKCWTPIFFPFAETCL